MEKTCTQCGKKFETDKSFAKECLDCYIKRKNPPEGQTISKPIENRGDATALRIARSVALDKAVTTFIATQQPVTTKTILHLADIYAEYIVSGKKTSFIIDEVVREEVVV